MVLFEQDFLSYCMVSDKLLQLCCGFIAIDSLSLTVSLSVVLQG